MLLSGYSRLPYSRLYCSEWADIHNFPVSDSLRHNRFDDILISDLYFRDNTNLSGDRKAYYKVRPIFEKFTGAFKQADVAEDISIYETMIPYFGKHGTKPFICEKPKRLNFSLWSLGMTWNGILTWVSLCNLMMKLRGISRSFAILGSDSPQSDNRKGNSIHAPWET